MSGVNARTGHGEAPGLHISTAGGDFFCLRQLESHHCSEVEPSDATMTKTHEADVDFDAKIETVGANLTPTGDTRTRAVSKQRAARVIIANRKYRAYIGETRRRSGSSRMLSGSFLLFNLLASSIKSSSQSV